MRRSAGNEARAIAACGVRSRQRGAALLTALLAVVLALSLVLLDWLGEHGRRLRQQRTVEAHATLADAVDTLVAWSVAHPTTPGRLPFPDRRDDSRGYDGIADCDNVPPVGVRLLIGRLPYQGQVAGKTGCPGPTWGLDLPPEGRDGHPLHYAVSGNLVHNGAAAVNPGLLGDGSVHGWLTVRDETGKVVATDVAAVLIAPGGALDNARAQSRAGERPFVDDYLDEVTIGRHTYRNWDFDGRPDGPCEPPPGQPPCGEDFIVHPHSDTTVSAHDRFNDVLAYVTAARVLRGAERRALAEAAGTLRRYADRDGDGVPDRAYPWMAPYWHLAGTATGGDATTLVDSRTSFAAAGIMPGDEVHVVTDGSLARITEVAGSTIRFRGGLRFGVDDRADALDHYEIRRFRGDSDDWGAAQREGRIPFTDPAGGATYPVPTPITVGWSGPVDVATRVDDRPPALAAAGLGLAPGERARLTAALAAELSPGTTIAIPPPPAGDGECLWRDVAEVDCTATRADRLAPARLTGAMLCRLDGDRCLAGSMLGPFAITRHVTLSPRYAGVPSPADGPGRDVASGDPLAAPIPTFATVRYAVTVPGHGGPFALGEASARAGMGSSPALAVRDIYTDPVDRDAARGARWAGAPDAAVSGDAFPGWLVRNRWHHYLYAKVSSDHVGLRAPAHCAARGTCIRLEVGPRTPARTDATAIATAIVIAAGPALASQRRASGAPADYFELENRIQGNGAARRNAFSTPVFNDQVRVVFPRDGG